MRVLCFGYRSWALRIYENIKQQQNVEVIIFDNKNLVDVNVLHALKPDLVLFFGWSWLVPTDIINVFRCFMLHPSDLPKYRGGSPIQNQIIDGITDTKLTLFQMGEGVDDGPIYGKIDLDLSGNISDIFGRLESGGTELTLNLINGVLRPIAQAHEQATYRRRRAPEQSEILINDWKSATGLEIYNKIRSLTDPYPNAFFRTSDGKRLYFKSVILDEGRED
jgi:methionyl-tRNA formyltransferase